MIVTVTMNPAIDKTITLAALKRGGLNRIRAVELDAGGKGINVSKTVRALGGETVATGFLGGSTGESIREMLTEQGIQCDFVQIRGETRTNIKIVEKELCGKSRPDGKDCYVKNEGADNSWPIVTELNEQGSAVTGLNEQGSAVTELNNSRPIVTELNESGPVVTEDEIAALMKKLEEYAGPNTLVVLSGSIPRGVDKNIYNEITELMHQKGAEVLLDADGELFANGLKAVPDIVKPNQKELEEYCRTEHGLPMDELETLAARLRNMGIGFVAVSLGEQGALFMEADNCYRCPALSVEAQSTVGAGDAMVAALALGWEQKLSLKETAALGIAVSAGAVMTQGTKPPEMEVVKELLSQVRYR